MYTQSTVPCDKCNGTGHNMNEKEWKQVKEKKILEVEVAQGVPDGERYVFHGESDEHPGIEPGDVIIQVKEKPHKLFKRKGADLMMEKEITLLQALTGVDFTIDFLDGKKLRI